MIFSEIFGSRSGTESTLKNVRTYAMKTTTPSNATRCARAITMSNGCMVDPGQLKYQVMSEFGFDRSLVDVEVVEQGRRRALN